MKKTIFVLAAGLALSAGSLTSAQAAPVHQAESASSVVSVTRDCSPYPGSVYTRTTLHLAKHRMRQGSSNTATVHVRSQTDADPKGSVVLTIRRTNGDGPNVQLFQRLHDGMARFSLPRHLHAGRYAVRATYIPKNCSRWAPSRSGVEYLKVVRHRHHHHHHH